MKKVVVISPRNQGKMEKWRASLTQEELALAKLEQVSEVDVHVAAAALRLSPRSILLKYKKGDLKGWRSSDGLRAKVYIYSSSVLQFAEEKQGRRLKVVHIAQESRTA